MRYHSRTSMASSCAKGEELPSIVKQMTTLRLQLIPWLLLSAWKPGGQERHCSQRLRLRPLPFALVGLPSAGEGTGILMNLLRRRNYTWRRQGGSSKPTLILKICSLSRNCSVESKQSHKISCTRISTISKRRIVLVRTKLFELICHHRPRHLPMQTSERTFGNFKRSRCAKSLLKISSITTPIQTIS